MRTLLINSSNLVPGTTNQFRYTFPQLWDAKPGAQVALANISIYNSTFNITASYGNNAISVTFGNRTYNWTIPDGYYSITDLNYWLQSQFISNNLFAVTTTGNQNVYFVTLTESPTRYSAQWSFYPLKPSSGYQLPDNTNLVLSPTGTCPQVNITTGLGKLLGFPVGVLPTAPLAIPFQAVSADYNLYPAISPVDTYTVLCSLINNPLANPNTYLHQVPLSVPLGQLISENITALVWTDVNVMQHRDFTITLADQFGNPLQNKDTSMTLTLVLMDPPTK